MDLLDLRMRESRVVYKTLDEDPDTVLIARCDKPCTC